MRFLYLLFIPALILAGCNSPSDSIANEQWKLDWCATPGKTLQQLGWVWTHNREIENYSSLLTDDYHFYFAAITVGQQSDDGYVIPASWDKSQDVQATQNMFDNTYNISLGITNWQDYDYNPGGTEFTAGMVDFRLYVWPEGPDFASLTEGSCMFDFQKIDGLWIISGWHDDEDGSLGTQRAQYHP